MINAYSLAIILTICIFMYFYSFIHSTSYQNNFMLAVASNGSNSSEANDKKGKFKQNPFLLLFDVAL